MDDARVRALAQQVLDDPGSHSPAQRFPSGGLNDGDIPIWDSRSKTWRSDVPLSPSKLKNYPNVSTSALFGDGSWRRAQTMDDVSYIRIQGPGLIGFIADTNYRIYNISGVSTVLESDTSNRLRNAGGGALSIDVAGNYLIGFYVVGRAALYEAGWTMTYNGVAIDTTAGNGVNYGGLGVVQQLSVSAMTITNYFSSPGYVQISGFQNDATINAAGLWAMWLPS